MLVFLFHILCKFFKFIFKILNFLNVEIMYLIFKCFILCELAFPIEDSTSFMHAV